MVLDKPTPEVNHIEKQLPDEHPLDKALPEEKPMDKPMPPLANPENVVVIGGMEIEIKPTLIKYQRNHTASAYRLLEAYPLPDILAMESGIIDPIRDGDAVVFDFLTAVFNDGEFVKENYDNMTADDVDRIVKIFKRLNHIDEKEEAAKNRAAKGTNN